MTTNTEINTEPKRVSRGPICRALRFLARCYDRHLQRLDLSELDDDRLRDIGLERRDVERECAMPFWR